MNKELFVSATPHETKVGITEDDQLAEIYLERENEYTLAGSIYKGRVTRVLPGMQSAFVDIGLERDAFLYVSDFMDLEQQDEDLDEPVPANRPVNGGGQPRRAEAVAAGAESAPVETGNETDETDVLESAESEPANSAEPAREGRDFRGRRRRRGRRDVPDRGRSSGSDRGEARTDQRNDQRTDQRSDQRTDQRTDQRSDQRTDQRGGRFDRGSSRFQRPTPTTTSRPGRDYDYGPPPGYQPIILPGESISKYQRQAQSAAPAAAATEQTPEPAIASNFPEDEPIFAAGVSEPLHEQHDHVAQVEAFEDTASASANVAPPVAELRAETEFRHEQVAAIETAHDEAETVEHLLPHEADFAAALAAPEELRTSEEPEADVRYEAGSGHVEEQEIEEEEADLAAYGDQLDEDDDFEAVEEETHAPGTEMMTDAVAAAPAEGETAGENGEIPEAVLEAEEREAEEFELEEAQAEAEALLEAEAIGAGTVDASAEVRSASPEARLLQRTRRVPDFDRRRGGRRGGGGQRRRFRSRENTVVPQISELLKEGQEILVQIAKEPIGKKGARITSHIALPGRFLVFMPTVNHTGVSRKISSEEERLRLKRIIQSERENGGGGFIVRTAAAGASDEELRADIRFLKNLWAEIKSRSDASNPPALIYHDLNVVERVLRDQVTSDFSIIWVDSESEYERILRFANRFQPCSGEAG